MKTVKLNFEDFRIEKLSKKQQLIVRGGDGDPPLPIDPGKGGGGNGNG
ncbi:rSAM-modified peptide [Flavobacterium reichenbachii]|nr:rSAM-modified peptide [Flavobacterium reichenbachii]